ncbi:MAG: glutamate--tRNA ligase [Campylobacterales bacterium]|nr:glutamate--tRNA ligase [Campylobacterales bacterium]
MTVTRFAPSPTGYLHIGGLRTALFSWLWARKNNGKFLLRIEDTDLSRNSQEATDAILEAFKWLGMDSDDEIVYQSERFELYKKYVQKLLDQGKAYYCYMSKEELESLRETQQANGERPRYDGRYRDGSLPAVEGIQPVVRIKAPLEGTVTINDGVKGEVVFNWSDATDDFIIARADGTPTYNFVVAIDDALMGVNEVIRGDDHLSNTPKQIVVYEALGLDTPKFYHVPMIHNDKGKKLSKRDGATDVMEYKKDGFLPQALLNFLVRLGWSNKDQEIFSLEEMIQLFDPNNINKSASAYNYEKLIWLNSHYIKNTDNEHIISALENYDIDLLGHDKKEILLDLAKEKGKTLVELVDEVKKFVYFPETYNEKDCSKTVKENTFEILDKFMLELEQKKETLHLPNDYQEIIDSFISSNELKMPELGKPLRLAFFGEAKGPNLADSLAVFGVDEIGLRINKLRVFTS